MEVYFPPGGGRIEVMEASSNGGRGRDDRPRYAVLGRTGEVRRVLLIDERGRVLEEIQRVEDEEEEEGEGKNSIKLGLVSSDRRRLSEPRGWRKGWGGEGGTSWLSCWILGSALTLS